MSMSLQGVSSRRPYPPVASTSSGSVELLRRDAAGNAVEKLPEQNVHQIRALPGDFAAAAAGLVPHAQAVLFDFSEAAEDLDILAGFLAGFLVEGACGLFEGAFLGCDH